MVSTSLGDLHFLPLTTDSHDSRVNRVSCCWQGPASSLPFPGMRQVSLPSLTGVKAKLFPPANVNSCPRFVNPDPSALPPQENKVTWSPACLRESKEMQPWVAVLTIRAASPPLPSLCLPEVIRSQVVGLVQSVRATGMRFILKSPAVGSTERHWPLEARILVLLTARTAVSSRCCASSVAA